MKMKITKKRLQEIIDEEYALYDRKILTENEDRRWDPDVSPMERMKDEIQTLVMDTVMSTLRTAGIRPEVLRGLEFELEEKLVDAMSGAEMTPPTSHPSVNETDLVSELELDSAIAEALEEMGLGAGKVKGKR